MPTTNVTAIERLLDIYEAFQASQRPLSLTEVAELAGLPKSTCHAIVGTLIARGYLYSLTRPRALYPTRRMFDVTRDIVEKDPFVERITPVLERLRDTSRETVILGKRQGNAVVYLQVVESAHSIRYSARPGEIKPLHSSSIGKAMLGCMKDPELQAWLHDRPLQGVTRATLTEPPALLADIQQGRRLGYFQTRGESVDDVWAMAASLVLNKETFAIAVAGPKHRMEGAMAECARLLVASCSSILRHSLAR
ncbi:IclR family transcriptional regulator [Bordetella sp. BOR01]|uniref:IclR family transcriptional regulator n=1 Tax=Bordetella sp. BOR01 TaxID=2854779 RepID=UPI001C44F86C|nr:IclR family transcriptional regulator [Bordetella sp. BOR01]MBV7485840.1 IclR family transcriptional regulator [Bordetella sp. BOR01]